MSRRLGDQVHVSAHPHQVRGTTASREVIPVDPGASTRWHQHDFPAAVARWNVHPEYEVHLIRHGYGQFLLADTLGQFGPGQLVLVGPDVPHYWYSDVAPGETVHGRDVVLQFHDRWIRACQSLLPELADLDLLLTTSTRGVEFTGRTALDAAAHLEQIGRSTGSQRLAATFALIATLASAPDHERRFLTTPWLQAREDPRAVDVIGRAVDYIFDHVHDDVRLPQVARLVGMSDSAFSRYLTTISGQTFTSMVRRLRLAKARQLLENTTEPIAVIAQRVGYANLSNFNRQFKADVGQTPRDYRTAHQHTRPNCD